VLGDTLTDDEQDILDAGQREGLLHDDQPASQRARPYVLLCICNSGRRSVAAASLLRSLGYPKALSVAGGFQAWKKLQAAPAAQPPATG
jgi:rhodanese-related sulfurtransferase